MTDTALELSNYTLDNVALPAGTTIGFVGNKNVVQITLPASYVITTNAPFKFGVSKELTTKNGEAIRLTDGDATTASTLQLVETITLEDNKAPQFSNVAKLLLNGGAATDSANQVKISFTEALDALDTTNVADDFIVKVNGTEVAYTAAELADVNKSIVLTLGTAYNTAQTITVELAKENLSITDVAGNLIVTGQSVTATK